jgi:hypothetical protein
VRLCALHAHSLVSTYPVTGKMHLTVNGTKTSLHYNDFIVDLFSVVGFTACFSGSMRIFGSNTSMSLAMNMTRGWTMALRTLLMRLCSKLT